MGKNVRLSTLLILILVTGWAIGMAGLPFSRETAIVACISVLIMTSIHGRYLFAYIMSAVLSYGAFLTIYAFAAEERSSVEMLYIYSHLLFTAFMLLYWLLLHEIKQIGYESDELRRRVRELQKYGPDSELLTVHEFMEQAVWVLKAAERNQEETWLVEIEIIPGAMRTHSSLRDVMEWTTLTTMRQKFDLATAVHDRIYLLLKGTSEEGVARVLARYQANLQQELNLVKTPYRARKERISHIGQLVRVKEEAV
ncbi:hypothetical protein [Planococcus lenghuensis]|uniref:GGDEF domain-containing protein n=1 Tax=Planococcus lenghuensis TaxID=2213202 RepID=A0A1Q2L2C9_9BACL|nr:hypothetical protein [Planococcus lenghuensis]AQQ54032.1 hypothetical protein B0X71_13610 [Planococcus lenghuensis]